MTSQQLHGAINYWWVNQNVTYFQEINGGYLWSPKKRIDGTRNPFYDTMTQVRPNDIVFSFAGTLIKAIGKVISAATDAPRPIEFTHRLEQRWDQDGWRVMVDFTELDHPLRPKDHMDLITPTLPLKYAPIQANGDGKQIVYLASVPLGMAEVLCGLLEGQIEAIEGAADLTHSNQRENEEDVAEGELRNRPDLQETEKEQLIKARRGQGIFKKNLHRVETKCRVTGVTDARHLRASHIKPWAKSADFEKLDGQNGLLLAPHLDHLFDQGFISFSNDGEVLISSHLNPQVLNSWALNLRSLNVGRFTPKQQMYLEFHRSTIFKD